MKIEYTEIFTDIKHGNNDQFYRVTVFKPGDHYKAPPYMFLVEYGDKRAEDWTMEWIKSIIVGDAANIREAINRIDSHTFEGENE